MTLRKYVQVKAKNDFEDDRKKNPYSRVLMDGNDPKIKIFESA